MAPASAQREAFARRVTSGSGWPAGDDRLWRAFASTPRERFLPPGASVEMACSDTTVGLLGGINNGQPSLHALSLAALAPQPGERVAHIGAGSGYYTAILAQLVGSAGGVEAYEIEPKLAARALRNLAAMPWVRVEARSGAAAPIEAADVIYVNCGATAPQACWLDALRPGGRLLFPLTGEHGEGAMLLVRQAAGPVWPARFIVPVLFIGCEGARDRGEAGAVAAAFAGGGAAAVRWLHREGEVPAHAWCRGRGWWLG
ncbi:MAG: protein-L-isoaspartate O-methyltransferase family protein [Terriglobales bacterium]